ncbi:MAG TPA: type II secretion system F family protein [Candidatus Limnocylindria bacterium]|nr:type II secretion system F family protein [Candidatus Limnocylindria bacterium]
MSVAGAAAAAVCVALLLLAAAPRSRVAARLHAFGPSGKNALQGLGGLRLIAPATLKASGLAVTGEQLVAAKITLALVGALLAAIIALFVPIGALVMFAAAYIGFILPSIVVERRAARRRRDAEIAIASFVEWTHALVLSGRSVDAAVIAVARRGTGAPLVDEVLTRVADLYTLGAPLHVSLSREAREAALASLTRLAERLERARELGQGSVTVLENTREELRSAARERLLASASGVEGKMTLILTLCYLPALALLVVVPLFVTLLAGLFG